MLALCSMLHPTYYAKNYAGIMGAGLQGTTEDKCQCNCYFATAVIKLGQTLDLHIWLYMQTLQKHFSKRYFFVKAT